MPNPYVLNHFILEFECWFFIWCEKHFYKKHSITNQKTKYKKKNMLFLTIKRYPLPGLFLKIVKSFLSSFLYAVLLSGLKIKCRSRRH